MVVVLETLTLVPLVKDGHTFTELVCLSGIEVVRSVLTGTAITKLADDMFNGVQVVTTGAICLIDVYQQIATEIALSTVTGIRTTIVVYQDVLTALQVGSGITQATDVEFVM